MVEIHRPAGTSSESSPCYNNQPSDDTWPASLPLRDDEASGIVEDQLGSNINLPCLETDSDKGTSEPYMVSIFFGDANDDANDEKQWMLVDSLVIRPLYSEFPIFNPDVTTEAINYQHEFENEQCLLKELEQRSEISNMSPACDKMTYTIAAWLHDGAESCGCDKQGSLDLNCNPKGGQCQCRPGVTGRTCNECKLGFYSFSSKGCTPCECSRRGTVNADQVGLTLHQTVYYDCI